MTEMKVFSKKVGELFPYENNARVHDTEQLEKLQNSIREFGFVVPVIIDEAGMILAGHGRVEAAKEMGLNEVPCVMVDDLTEDQKKAYILADNLLTERGEWDLDKLENEMSTMTINMADFGFDEIAETEDVIINEEEDYITCPKCGWVFREEDQHE